VGAVNRIIVDHAPINEHERRESDADEDGQESVQHGELSMRSPSLATFIVATSIWCTVTPALAKGKTFTVVGFGAASCGRWLDARHAGSDASMPFVAWAQGYITAINQYVDHTQDANVISGTDIDGIAHAIDNFCSQNPTSKFIDAIDEVVGSEIVKNTLNDALGSVLDSPNDVKCVPPAWAGVGAKCQSH
jgi:hypothetical protein